MHQDDHTDARDPEEFDPQVTVVYDLPDATVEVSIDVYPHDGAAFDLPHLAFTERLRESVTTFCQLHHYYQEDPDLLLHAGRPVGAVQYYVELAFAHAMIDALGEDRARVDLTRRVLLLEQLVDSLGTAVRRNASMSQAVSTAQSALQLAEEFDIDGSVETLRGLERRIPIDLGRYLPTDPEDDDEEWVRRVEKMNHDCLDYTHFVFVDDTQSAEEYEDGGELDDKSKLIVSLSDEPLSLADVRLGRRIFPHTV